MAYNIITTPEASLDIFNASFYYESLQPGLSDRFIAELITVYKKLEDNPQHYSFISSRKKTSFRDIKFNIFPYVAIFDITGNVVTIHAVMNTYQNPRFK